MNAFDEVINRTATDSSNGTNTHQDVIPMWVADMDFAAPESGARCYPVSTRASCAGL